MQSQLLYKRERERKLSAATDKRHFIVLIALPSAQRLFVFNAFTDCLVCMNTGVEWYRELQLWCMIREEYPYLCM